MGKRNRIGIKGVLVPVCIFAGLAMSTVLAADGGSSAAVKAASPDAQATKIFFDYCRIMPRRDLRGVPMDPSLSDKQIYQYRVDSYNGTEKKLAAMRQKLMKLGQPTVEKMLQKQMETQSPDDTDNLMCAMEIVARSLPQEYEDYAKRVKPGIDQSGFVDYVRETFLGKNHALHEDLSAVTP